MGLTVSLGVPKSPRRNWPDDLRQRPALPSGSRPLPWAQFCLGRTVGSALDLLCQADRGV